MKKAKDMTGPSPLGLQRLGNSALADWFRDPDGFEPEAFAEQIRHSIYQIHGEGAVVDEHLVAMLTDQMSTYCIATGALKVEPLVEAAINGTRMINPNYRLRDSCLTRILQLITMAGLAPNGRPKKTETASAMNDLLAGPKFN
jgi:hypothetical protein